MLKSLLGKKDTGFYNLLIEDVIDTEFTKDVRVGDLITHINGVKAANFFVHNSQYYSDCHYQIYSKSLDRFIQITSPIPIAIKAMPCSQFLASEIAVDGFDMDYLEVLWERHDYELLAQAISNIKNSGIISSIMNVFGKNRYKDTPITLFEAVLKYHQGENDSAEQLLHFYIEKVMSGYTTNFHAIAYLYLALLNESDEDVFYHYLNESNDLNKSRSKVINEYLKKYDIDPLTDSELITQKFPFNFTVKGLNDDITFDLEATLDEMHDDQLLPLCIMPGYRANGPYSDIMMLYSQAYPYFQKYLLPMHIITNPPQHSAAKWWFDGENKAKKNKIPFFLFNDPVSNISQRLEQYVSPKIYVLNKQGVVVSQGSLSAAFDYWELVHKHSSN